MVMDIADIDKISSTLFNMRQSCSFFLETSTLS